MTVELRPPPALAARSLSDHHRLMNAAPKLEFKPSTCPHDCPSACALEVEVLDGRSIGRVRGAKQQTYTAGVICAKVARYAERMYHPERLPASAETRGTERRRPLRAHLMG